MDYRTEDDVRLIGSHLGFVIEIESNDITWDKSTRLRVDLNITKPLCRVSNIPNSKGVAVFIDLKYERLPMFCYACGVIGHIERGCNDGEEDEREVEKQ